MTTVLIVCAAVGGTVLVIQFLLTLVGLGGHAFDVDVPHDIGHGFGGDFHVDTGGDFHGDAGFHGDHGGDATAAEHDAQAAQHGTTWLFGILTFRTVTAALAFFGLCGLAAQAAEASTAHTLLAAAAGGATAMAAVYWMMRGLRELSAEGPYGSNVPWADTARSTSASPATTRAAGKSRSTCKIGPWTTWPSLPAPSCQRELKLW